MSEPLTLSRSNATIKFSIHPLAHAAYQWLLAYPKLVSWNNLPSNLTNQLNSQPLQGVMYYQQAKTNGKISPTEFCLVAPLWPAMYWENASPCSGQ